MALARVVLFRQVLKSTYMVSDRENAKRLGMKVEEVQDMLLAPVMTPMLAVMVWQNTNKLAGLVEGGGVGRKRFWACMYMFMKEGLVKGDVDTYVAAHSRDERWEGMADEMMTLQRLGPHWAPKRWVQEEGTGSGGWAIEAAPGTGADQEQKQTQAS